MPEPSEVIWTLARAGVVAFSGLAAAVAVTAVELNRLPDDERPTLAAALWPSNPDGIQDNAMREIGLAAARGGTVPDDARKAMRRLARLAPLRPDPYLVEATIAATGGDGDKAERLFKNAAARDPRSVLAHFSLADRYLRTNRLHDGLEEISVLGQLVPSATVSLAGPLATYARQPGTAPALQGFFARSPWMAAPVLGELAKDPAQAGRAISLGQGLPAKAEKGWQQVVIQTLIDAHDYGRAQAAWRKFAGVGPYNGLYNPGFAAASTPPPFNWAPLDGNAALVEPSPGGGLKLVYYGRQDTLITRQLLVLAPGHYVLAMAVGAGPISTAVTTSTDPSGGVAWQVSCADGGAVLGSLPLRAAAPGRATLAFSVPPTCRSEWLSLRGTAGGFGEAVALTISEMSLRPSDAQ